MRRVETAAQMLNRLDREAEGLRALLAARVSTGGHEHEGPRGVLGYAQVTSDQGSIIGGITDLTGLTVSVNVAADRRIRITGYTAQWLRAAPLADGNGGYLMIREGSTVLQHAAGVWYGSSAVAAAARVAQVVLTPSSGSHTYKLSHERFGGTHVITMSAHPTLPAWIMVEDIGAA